VESDVVHQFVNRVSELFLAAPIHYCAVQIFCQAQLSLMAIINYRTPTLNLLPQTINDQQF